MLWPCLPVRTMALAWLVSTRAVDRHAHTMLGQKQQFNTLPAVMKGLSPIDQLIHD